MNKPTEREAQFAEWLGKKLFTVGTTADSGQPETVSEVLIIAARAAADAASVKDLEPTAAAEAVARGYLAAKALLSADDGHPTPRS